MFVLDSYRGKGIASKMLDLAIKSVKEYFEAIREKPRRIFLFVSENNTGARALYEKKGFKPISSVGDLFRDSNTEMFYSMKL